MTWGDLTLAQFALVALVAFGAQIVGGLAGYGTGLIMPLVLVPTIGAEAVVPVIALSALITNPTRVYTFRHDLDVRKALVVSATALPTVGLGAWGFTLLSGAGATLLIGTMLIILVPLRRYLKRLQLSLGERGLATAGVGFGFVMGGTTGSGALLISMLMAAGLTGTQVIATDAAVSTILGVVKAGVFFGAGVLPPSLWLVAILIGVMATPGALVARWLSTRFSAGVHDKLLEATIIFGGLLLIWRALTMPA